ncbi:hypothetical protein B0103_25270 [Salmonella enterica]|nr:hypothetical protein [Salmonella enterica]ECU6221860.1 hypothetical protein [Salmonella enterica subsp. enterica serovar Idikan]
MRMGFHHRMRVGLLFRVSPPVTRIEHNASLRAPLRRPERVSDGKRVKQVTTLRQTRQKRRG